VALFSHHRQADSTLQVAKRVYSQAKQQNDSAIIMVLAGQALDEVRRELGRDGVSDFQRRATELARNAWNLSEERQEQRKIYVANTPNLAEH
jgi:hypothetical protein